MAFSLPRPSSPLMPKDKFRSNIVVPIEAETCMSSQLPLTHSSPKKDTMSSFYVSSIALMTMSELRKMDTWASDSILERKSNFVSGNAQCLNSFSIEEDQSNTKVLLD
ncbi:uncharacterized protein PHALS_01934 [Plasmopara halstedii]|uniref:Uncharacterized protein n=1 Tax=Plasmopara halstedii TaxID=4781 RepID=A0A0N7L6Z5_PLAHL|nr:uncharacterized protein PHALS_01934 [Plasmopara halstedii]CEG45651.1 hypothetical protein PHALS_01934 [Plasmopara halstedii]|eukprot:XP_024582020.1 hypothetical protein PHALS_01934 [Plasmopara halstedii]